MNRKQRRAARKGSRKGQVITTEYGTLDPRDRNYGLQVACYVCGTGHSGLNLARIHCDGDRLDVPLCVACAASDEASNAVVRIYLGAPDLVVEQGGEATGEQVEAFAAKLNSTEH